MVPNKEGKMATQAGPSSKGSVWHHFSGIDAQQSQHTPV